MLIVLSDRVTHLGLLKDFAAKLLELPLLLPVSILAELFQRFIILKQKISQ